MWQGLAETSIKARVVESSFVTNKLFSNLSHITTFELTYKNLRKLQAVRDSISSCPICLSSSWRHRPIQSVFAVIFASPFPSVSPTPLGAPIFAKKTGDDFQIQHAQELHVLDHHGLLHHVTKWEGFEEKKGENKKTGLKTHCHRHRHRHRHRRHHHHHHHHHPISIMLLINLSIPFFPPTLLSSAAIPSICRPDSHGSSGWSEASFRLKTPVRVESHGLLILPRDLTWNPKMMVSKRSFLF